MGGASASPFENGEIRPALVFEDPGGDTLDGFLAGAMEMTQFLRLAVGLASALVGLHQKGMIHKDVKPHNVLVIPQRVRSSSWALGSRRVFGASTRRSKPPEFIAGTLPYMAPEQTGRMNRSIDSRSDLYTLGIVLLRDAHRRAYLSQLPIRWNGFTTHIGKISEHPAGRG